MSFYLVTELSELPVGELKPRVTPYFAAPKTAPLSRSVPADKRSAVAILVGLTLEVK